MSKPQRIEEWLNALGMPSADRDYKPGHERMHALLHKLEDASFTLHLPKLRIRIAGTNGKGSTANFLASAFQANGYKTALYTSPHIHAFNERIRINGNPIDDEQLLQLMEVVMPLALDAQTSYFETATVLALLYFSQQQVDVEVLEAGVGARLDATTAVNADVGVLTPVAIDHEAWLGNTLEAIAMEKSYIFKNCTIACSAPQPEEIVGLLKESSPQLHFSKPYEAELAMKGEHQQINTGLAIETLKQIQSEWSQTIPLDMKTCEQVIEQMKLEGRFEQISFQGHNFYVDAAHNAHAVVALAQMLANDGYRFDAIVVKTREDRDLSNIISILNPFTENLICQTGAQAEAQQSIEATLTELMRMIEQGNFLILGSFITVDAVKRWLKAKSF